MSALAFQPSFATRTAAKKGSRQLRDAILIFKGIDPPKDPTEPRMVRLCPSCHTPIAPGRHLIADIQQTVGSFYGFHRDHILSERRNRELTRARQVAMFLASELTPHSVAEIGRRFNRDHTTVLHAIKQVKDRAENNEEDAFNITLLRERFGA